MLFYLLDLGGDDDFPVTLYTGARLGEIQQ